MRSATLLFVLATILFLALSGCAPGPSSTATPEVHSPTPVPPKVTPVPPTPTPVPPAATSAPPTPTLVLPTQTSAQQGEIIIVASTADTGPGTLRQALLDAETHDVITFDPSVFPPDAPATIALSSSLPELNQGSLTIDASNAGVILDGSNITTPDPQHGLSISSDGNIIRGLQITGFSNAGIGLYGGAQSNVIGGDRSVGDGPLGQGNLIGGNANFGIGLWDQDTSHNTIQGNYIGINIDGTSAWGHARDGIHSNGATYNLITDNVIGGSQLAGVYLCCALDGWNTVTDNLIGVGPRGRPLGNGQTGVLIDRSSYNVVGPGNLIAHNLGDGIRLWEDTANNTITQNSIQDNGGQGIGLPGSQTALQRPMIISWDLQAGTLSGAACANCTIEIFSDTSDEGGIYEGRTEAGGDGVFSFAKGASFTGPNLTATATDPDGHTSEFSPPSQGDSRNLSLQNGNALPILFLETKPSSELADNRIGATAETRHIGDSVWNTGLKWMRVIVDSYGQWQHVDWEKDEYAIDPSEEQTIDDLLSNGVSIMLVLDVWYPNRRVIFYKSEEDIQIYLNWVRFMVRHFRGRIEYYEILNEPDLSFEAASGMPLDAYVNLIQRTVPIIREEDPQAKIVVGALPDTRFDDARDYMWGLLNSEVMPLVDGFSWHGMYGAAPSDDPRGVRNPEAPQMTGYWENYPALVQEIKRVAASAGFNGEYFVEEMLWRTPAEQHESEPSGFTDTSGAKYYARAMIIHLGLDVTTGIAAAPEDVRPRSYSVIRALCTVMAGAEAADLPIVIESASKNLKYYGFTLPNGDMLAALWTDGAAVEDEPGVNITLTFPNLSAQRVIGVDVLNGIEQQLITATDNGNLVIRNLLVQDYPIILRLIR
jgi:hypothetical protein